MRTLDLVQINDTIRFGTEEHRHVLSIKSGQYFKKADVTSAADDLLAEYPEEAETIARYAAKLMTMAKG